MCRMAGTGIRKSNAFYVAKVACLKEKLSRLNLTASGFEADNAKLRHQEQVLHKLCKQQGSIFELLSNATPAGVDVAEDSSQSSHSSAVAGSDAAAPQQQQGTEWAATAAATTPEQAEGYALGLLAATTHSHQHRAATMTPQDWCAYYGALVAKVCLLQSVIQQRLVAQQQQDPCLPPSPEHSTPTASATAQSSSATAHLPNVLLSEDSTLQQAEQQLRALVDEFYSLILSAHVDGAELMYRQAAFIDLSTGVQVQEVPASHWQSVAQAVQLSPQQVAQLKGAFQQFQRYKRALQSQQQAAVSGMVAVTQQVQQMLHSAAGSSSHSPQTAEPCSTTPSDVPSAGTERSSSATTTSSTAADKRCDDDAAGSTEQLLLSQLQGVLSGASRASTMFILFGLNTMTHWQRTQLLIKSYPFLPRAAAFIEAVLDVEQQQQQQQQQLQPQQESAAPSVQPAQCKLGITEQHHQRQLRRRRALLDKQRREFWANREGQLSAVDGLRLPADQLGGVRSHEQLQQQQEAATHAQQHGQVRQVQFQPLPVVLPAQQGLNQHQQQHQQQAEKQQELLDGSIQDRLRLLASTLWQLRQEQNCLPKH